LEAVGLPGANFLGTTTTALPSISFIDAWWQTGFVFIILHAGLQALPAEPFEAAEVDGAGYWQRFRYITLPMMKPVVGVVAGIRSIDCLKVFALVFGTTSGGPQQSTQSIQMLAYRTAFQNNQMSMSMTMMVSYALIIMVVAGAVLGVRRLRRSHA